MLPEPRGGAWLCRHLHVGPRTPEREAVDVCRFQLPAGVGLSGDSRGTCLQGVPVPRAVAARRLPHPCGPGLLRLQTSGGGAACPSRCDSLTFVCHHISAGRSQERALILRTPTMTPSPLGGQKEWLHLQVGNVRAQGGRPQNVPQWHNDGFELVVCQAARARRGMSRLCCPSNAGHKSPPGKVLSLLPEAERDTVGLASKVRGSRAGRLT